MNWQKYLKISLLVIILILIGGYVYLRMKGMWVTVVVKGKKVMVGVVMFPRETCFGGQQ